MSATAERPAATPGAEGAALVEVRGLSKRYGGVQAVDAVDLRWDRGRVHGLIGPNGAGKSTLVNLVTGVDRPDAGSVHVHGREVTGWAPHRIAARGIARTFQTAILMEDETVLDNVLVGCHRHARYRFPFGLLPTPNVAAVERRERARALAALERLGVERHADARAGDLSYGARRLVEVARAIVSGASVLILDEPAAGLPDGEATALGRLLRSVAADTGAAVILIEHNVRMVLETCDHVTVLAEGAVLEEGEPAQIRESRTVIETYLGRRRAARAEDADA